MWCSSHDVCVCMQRLRSLKEYETGRKFGKRSGYYHLVHPFYLLTPPLPISLSSPPFSLLSPLLPSPPGGHRSNEEEKEKMVSAQMVAIERAQMRARQQRRLLLASYNYDHDVYSVS